MDQLTLNDVLALPKDDLKSRLSFTNEYLHIDRGGRILCVAHIDTVFDDVWDEIVPVGDKSGRTFAVRLQDTIICPTLDDRLGVYLALLFAEKHNEDVLLTDNEEMCASTARIFAERNSSLIKERYNWIVEFDRRDVVPVTYGSFFNCDDMILALKDTFTYVGHGTYTDICELQHLGVGAFNLGIGYHDEHTERSYLVISEAVVSFTKLESFYDKHRDTRFRFDPSLVASNTSVYPFRYSDYDPYYIDYPYIHKPRTFKRRKEKWNAKNKKK